LRHIIEKRIGMEHFTDKLSQLAKHESYSHAAKKPQLTCKQPSEVIFDYEFTRLFKQLESKSVVSFSVALFLDIFIFLFIIIRDNRKSQKSRKPWFSSKAVILPKCCECHVLPCFLLKCRGFTFFYKITLFLISISWSLLYEHKNNYLCFCLCYQSLCALLLTCSICDRDVIVEICILPRICIFLTLDLGDYEL